MAQVLDSYDLDTFLEAFGHQDWDAMMKKEYHSLLANDTWDFSHLPKERKKLVRCKWVYKMKYGPDGRIDKHKDKLVVKGFS